MENFRTIKFRAWNHESLEMAYNFDVPSRYSGFIEDPIGKERDWPIMQYTGLKDKNGKEIYEGDIVNIWEPEESNSTTAGMLRWKNQKIVFSDGGFCVEMPTTAGIKAFNLCGYNKHIEIIGNIYENPELL